MGWRIPLVDLAAEAAAVGPELESALLRVLRSGAYVLGPETQAFEAELAARVGVRFAIGVGSGTEALILSLRALGVGPGDEVITTPFSFVATAASILQVGATPVFADLAPDSFLIDPEAVLRAITPRTRAILPVHLFGACADTTALAGIARGHGLFLVEDAAQALDAERDGRRAGATGIASCFSFYPTKNLGAAGDAGAVATNDAALAERIRMLRAHGSPDGAHFEMLGTTSRLDSLQAAVLRAKLPHLETWNARRALNAGLYREHLRDCPGLELPLDEVLGRAVHSQFVVRVAQPERVREGLAAQGIEARRYYARPLYAEPALAAARVPKEGCPEAERAAARALAIPVRPSLAEGEVHEVAAALRRICSALA
jgi:dTDP-4-amino-4,6-dideoxygalactose transaminase